MPAWGWILVAVAAVAVIAIVAWAATRSRRTKRLREQFGPEYDRTVDETGQRSRAESELIERERRRQQLEIRPLSAAARQRYIENWRGIQAGFVDDPANSVREADSLLARVMRDRGYPVDDFEQRAADISVDHPQLVDNYRHAHAVAERGEAGQASTEELREALVYYRGLFDELLETNEPEDVSRTG